MDQRRVPEQREDPGPWDPKAVPLRFDEPLTWCSTWNKGNVPLVPIDCWILIVSFVHRLHHRLLRRICRGFATIPPKCGHTWTPGQPLHVVCARAPNGRRVCAMYRTTVPPDVRYDPVAREVYVCHVTVSETDWSFERLRWYTQSN